MVDEQRINIGTLKALGYTVFDIAKKYILYAFTASIAGSVLGLLIGFSVFPIVIFYSYGMMYTLPNMQVAIDIVTSYRNYDSCSTNNNIISLYSL